LRQSLRTAIAALATSLCLAFSATAQPATPTYDPPPPPGSPEAALDTFERRLAASHGQLLTLTLSGRERKVVFYAPFSAVWLLDETGDGVDSTARLTRTRDHLYLDRGNTIQLVSVQGSTQSSASKARHPLATFHDRLLSQPLARSIAGLPAGSRFVTRHAEPGGLVLHPGDAALQPAGATLWRSLGDHIVIQHGTGQPEPLHWRDVDAALKGTEG